MNILEALSIDQIHFLGNHAKYQGEIATFNGELEGFRPHNRGQLSLIERGILKVPEDCIKAGWVKGAEINLVRYDPNNLEILWRLVNEPILVYGKMKEINHIRPLFSLAFAVTADILEKINTN